MAVSQDNSPVKITIVVATLNCAATLARCIRSCIDQEYEHKELIVIDGGSTDETVAIIKEFDNSISYWVSEPDRGIYHAWNKALEISSGDWVVFLGGDDFFWSTSVLGDMVPCLSDALASSNIVYGQVNVIRKDGSIVEKFGEPWERIRKRFRQMMVIPHQGVFHHRSFFEQYGVFNETYKIAGDYEILVRKLKDESPVFVPTVIAAMQNGGVSSNPDFSLKTIREIARARREHKVGGVPLLLLWAYSKVLVVKVVSQLAGKKASARLVNSYRKLTGRASI